jgi:hypothetical protein
MGPRKENQYATISSAAGCPGFFRSGRPCSFASPSFDGFAFIGDCTPGTNLYFIAYFLPDQILTHVYVQLPYSDPTAMYVTGVLVADKRVSGRVTRFDEMCFNK